MLILKIKINMMCETKKIKNEIATRNLIFLYFKKTYEINKIKIIFIMIPVFIFV
jgi:hypothetical protein